MKVWRKDRNKDRLEMHMKTPTTSVHIIGPKNMVLDVHNYCRYRLGSPTIEHVEPGDLSKPAPKRPTPGQMIFDEL